MTEDPQIDVEVDEIPDKYKDGANIWELSEYVPTPEHSAQIRQKLQNNGASPKFPEANRKPSDYKKGATRYLVQTKPFSNGGMGAVYEAYDIRLGQEVIVKENILPGITSASDRGELEAKSQARIFDIPGLSRYIPRVYDYIERHGLNYIVMEKLDPNKYKSIGELVKADNVPLETVLNIITQLADALSIMADNGIMHGDVTPSNLLVSNGGNLKLIDFGATNFYIAKGERRQSKLYGTARYAGFHLPAGEINKADNIFHTAAIAYEMVTGESLIEHTPDEPLVDVLNKSRMFVFKEGSLQYNKLMNALDARNVSTQDREKVTQIFKRTLWSPFASEKLEDERIEDPREFARVLAAVIKK